MGGTHQILVVNDDFTIVSIIETALKEENYQMLSAHDGKVACHIENNKNSPYDYLALDFYGT